VNRTEQAQANIIQAYKNEAEQQRQHILTLEDDLKNLHLRATQLANQNVALQQELANEKALNKRAMKSRGKTLYTNTAQRNKAQKILRAWLDLSKKIYPTIWGHEFESRMAQLMQDTNDFLK